MRLPVLFRASLAGVALATTGDDDSLTFRPEAGTTLGKVFETSGEYALDAISLIADGQDVGDFLGQIEVSLESSATFEISDVYRAVGEGRPLDFLRTFERLESLTNMSVPQAPQMPEITIESELEGKTVAFKWNAETGEYERSFHECEGSVDLLEGLEEDMDLRFLLPDGEVEIDGAWTIELVDLRPLLMPGGDLHFAPEGAEMDAEAMEIFEGFLESLGEKVGELLDGECVCTFKGVRDEDGARLGEVQIEIEAAGSLDLRELIHQIIETALAEAPEEVEVDIDIGTADLALDYEGSGVLLWDVGAGRLHSFSLAGEMGFALKLAAEFAAMGESHKIDAALEISGEVLHEVAAQD